MSVEQAIAQLLQNNLGNRITNELATGIMVVLNNFIQEQKKNAQVVEVDTKKE